METKFGCQNCGHEIKAISPDDIRTLLCLENIENCIKIVYDCDNCPERNIRYWCYPDPPSVIR